MISLSIVNRQSTGLDAIVLQIKGRRFNDKRIFSMRVLCLIAALVCYAARPVLAQRDAPPRPLTVEGIRHWQHTGALKGWSDPTEIKLYLRDDNRPELFLAIGGFSRGMTYALFTQQGRFWKLLSDSIDCTSGLIDVLQTEHHGYADFVAFQRSGRGGYFVRVYSWNGRRYVKKADGEMSQDMLYNRE